MLRFGLLSALTVLLAWLCLSGRPAANLEPHVRIDEFGEPLPPGVLRRLGTAHLRHASSVSAVAFSPDGKAIWSSGEDGWTHQWNAANGRKLKSVRTPIASEPTGVFGAPLGFSPGGRLLAILGGGEFRADRLHLWDTATGQVLVTLGGTKLLTQLSVGKVAFACEGTLLAVMGAWDDDFQLFDLKAVRRTQQCKLPGQMLALAPNG